MNGGGMSFGREKRLLLGWLALMAPIPLPFNQVLEWPVLLLYAALIAVFLQRAERDPERWLPNWALNLLGLAYLPFLAFDLQSAVMRANPIRVLVHLLLFLVVVKLFSLRNEKDKWHVAIMVFYLFVGAMATSSHLTIVLYLFGFAFLGLFVLGRFAHLHLLTGLRRHETGHDIAGRRPAQRWPLAVGMFLATVLAVPLFAFLPRLGEPWVLGRGTGTGTLIASTGFSDTVDLSLTSTIRTNREVVLRIQYDDASRNRSQMRLKGGTYDLYRDNRWHTLRETGSTRRMSREAGVFWLGEGDTSATAEIYLEPIGSRSLILPMETLRVDLRQIPFLELDAGGAVAMPIAPRATLEYRVDVGDQPAIPAQFGRDPQNPVGALDLSGVSERMRQLAAEVMGEGTPEERLDRLEQHLLTSYAYTLDFVGRDGKNPLDDFLFVYKSGHCEYFASAMVLMARSQGISARLATGFLGAELNPLEGYYVVRQQNAHAWVEAYTPDRSWQVYDPTPPEGRPALAARDWKLMLAQVYDYLLFRWDRYVLTFSAEDQASFFIGLRQRWAELWERLAFWEKQDVPEEPSTAAAEAAPASTTPASMQRWTPALLGLWVVGLGVLGLAAALLYRRWRALPTAEAAYRGLRRQLRSAGLEVVDSTAPLALATAASRRFPAAGAATRGLVELYLRESFAGRQLSRDERLGLRESLRTIDAALEPARKQQRRQQQRRGLRR